MRAITAWLRWRCASAYEMMNAMDCRTSRSIASFLSIGDNDRIWDIYYYYYQYWYYYFYYHPCSLLFSENVKYFIEVNIFLDMDCLFFYFYFNFQVILPHHHHDTRFWYIPSWFLSMLFLWKIHLLVYFLFSLRILMSPQMVQRYGDTLHIIRRLHFEFLYLCITHSNICQIMYTVELCRDNP